MFLPLLEARDKEDPEDFTVSLSVSSFTLLIDLDFLRIVQCTRILVLRNIDDEKSSV